MNKNFLKFKKRLRWFRILKASLAGISCGALVFGGALLSNKLELIPLSETAPVFMGAGAALTVFLMVFFALWTSDKRLARELDKKFKLHEKVQTALAFKQESGEMYELQRADTEITLEQIPKSRLKARGLWVYLVALLLCAGVLTAGLLIKEKEPDIPPEEIVPFEISKMQIAGIEELIKYVDTSEMEEPYKGEISGALTRLLAELKAATTEPEMQAALAVALTRITETTYDSSSMTEILNQMWSTGDTNVMMLAKALNTSHWKEPDWGDFAEKYDAFRVALTVESNQDVEQQSREASDPETPTEAPDFAGTLRWTLENLSRKANSALIASGIKEEDRLYASVSKLINGGEELLGLASIPTAYPNADADELTAAIDATLSKMTNEFYETIKSQKNNTNVGEYTLTRLGMLFSVPIPAFERPDFVKNGEDINRGDQELEDKENDKAPSSGGVGEGVQFGSDDLVLDPLTGQYVEYGTLYAKYNALMIEKLGNEKYGYTEEQKKAIEKYFALLYGGFKDEEK